MSLAFTLKVGKIDEHNIWVICSDDITGFHSSGRSLEEALNKVVPCLYELLDATEDHDIEVNPQLGEIARKQRKQFQDLKQLLKQSGAKSK